MMHPALAILKQASLSYHIGALENWESELVLRLESLEKERVHAVSQLASIRHAVTERRKELKELINADTTGGKEANRT